MYKTIIVSILLTSFSVLSLASTYNNKEHIPNNYERTVDLEGLGCSDVQWSVDKERAEITLSWKSASADVQWIGLGISENGGMHGADIVTVRQDLNGDGFLVDDRFSMRKERPVIDYIQDYELLYAGVEDDGRIHAVVKRKIKTCDDQDIDVESYRQHIICAEGFLDKEGDISFHGPLISRGKANLMYDEDLLIKKDLIPPEGYYEDKIAPGITVRSSINTSLVPVPIDVQAMNVTSITKTGTTYICQLVNNPTEARYTAFEQVWTKGGLRDPKTSDEVPRHVHHISFGRLYDGSKLIDSQKAGQPFDCTGRMPDNFPLLTIARGLGQMEAPPNVHFTMRKGYHVLIVHYENPTGHEIVSEYPGVRLWTQPPHIPSSTQPGQVTFNDAEHASIYVPRDPEEKEVTLQFLISAETTQAILPETGIEVFANFVHMHRSGVRAHVQLVRDGKNIFDPLDSRSYDFDLQSPNWRPWRFLPGDALVISCTYKARGDKDIVGGLQTDQEMCMFIFGSAPELPQYKRLVSSMVPVGDPFQPTFPSDIQGKLSDTSYEARPKRNDFVSLKDYRKNFCDILLRDTLDAPSFSFSELGAALQIVGLGAIIFCRFLGSKFVSSKLGISGLSLREKRNCIVYIGEILFSTIALPFVIIAIRNIFQDYDGSYDAYDVNKYTLARGFCNVQSMLYLLELMYRINPAPSLVVHHLVTTAIVIILNYMIYMGIFEIALVFGLLLILFAMTEQPVYAILLMKNLNFRNRYPNIWPGLCYFAAATFCAVRVSIIVLLGIWLGRAYDEDYLDYMVRDVSYSSWMDEEGQLSSTAFAVTMTLGVIGLVLSNIIAVQALLRMAKPPRIVNEPKHQSPMKNPDRRNSAVTATMGEMQKRSSHGDTNDVTQCSHSTISETY